MAFVAVLPAAGTVLTGLGAAASSIPLIGGTLGALGGGLGGSLLSLGSIPVAGLGAGLSGAASSLGGGLLGAGAGLYSSADKLLGGFLPSLGGLGVTPQQGFLGHGDNALLGGAGMGLIGGPGQFLGPAVAAAPQAGLTVPGAQPSQGPLGMAEDKFKGVLGQATGAADRMGVGSIFDMAGKARGLVDAYNGPGGTPAQQAQMQQGFIDSPKVQPISAAPASVTPVSLVSQQGPSGFKPSATLLQQQPEMQGPASPETEEKLQRLLDALEGRENTDMRFISPAAAFQQSLERDAQRI